MLCAYTTHTAGHDFTALSDELAEFCSVFVVDMFNLINAELTDFAPALPGTGLHFAVFH